MKTFFSGVLKGLMGLTILACIVAFITYSRLPGMVSSDLSKRFKVPVSIEDITLEIGRAHV